MEKIEKIELRNIVKKFPGVIACNDINIDFHTLQVHSLLGENGAGKTTLMGVLYGKYKPDKGDILINGKKVILRTPQDAISLGIGMVHQHFMLVPSLTVTENIILNYNNGIFLNLKTAKERIKEISDEYGIKVNPDAFIWQLSVGEQQQVEILKLLFRHASFLILDEPTAVLTPGEVKNFFITIRKLISMGHGVILITHKLQEVMEISDMITVLRNGNVAGKTKKENTDKKSLAGMMVGRDIITPEKREKNGADEIIFQIKELYVENEDNLPAVKNFSLEIKKGEILGIAGVSGNGQKELAEAIAGLRRVKKGKILLKNIDITNKNPETIIGKGISFIPEERMVMGIIKDFSVSENAILKKHFLFPLSKCMFLNFKHIRDFTENMVKDFNIKTPSLDTPVKNLSGGNIQKLILAREMTPETVLLIASHPTRGVDIGATEYIHKRLLHMKENGMSILLISEDLDEILALSDRIAVIYEGEIAGIVSPSVSPETMGLMMGGENIREITK